MLVPVAELIPLAIASAFWPTLLVVDVIALRASHPGRLLAAFLAGGLLTTMTIGLAVIYALQDSALITKSRGTTDPTVSITVGVLAVLAAGLVRRRLDPAQFRRTPKDPDRGPSRLERWLARGTPVAFAVGIALNVVPGPFPLVALKDIAEADWSVPATVGVLLAFYAVMFTFIEVPLAAYIVSPERAASLTTRFNAWLDRHTRELVIGALVAAGLYLIVSGIITAVT
jgi:hypothetical protein